MLLNIKISLIVFTVIALITEHNIINVSILSIECAIGNLT